MSLTRRNFAAALTGLATAGTAHSATRRPNFVFVLVDDLRWDALSCMNHPWVKTPNIDTLARDGGLFRNAFVTTPLCSPSRGSFLTGQYVRAHNVRGNGDNAARSHQMLTFPRLLADAGYDTGYVGKWHMGTDDQPRPGFRRWVSFRGQGQYGDPEMNFDGQRVKKSGYMTDLLNQAAVDFLKESREKPFCLYVAHKAVHGPFTPADRHKTLYSDAVIRRASSATDDLQGKPVLQRPDPRANQQRGPSDDVIRNQMRCVAAIDDGVGALLETLREKKQLDNTVVVFTSDNGYFWGEHGLGDKRAAYDESIRIPLLMRYPRLIRPATRYDQLALNIDIAPTFLEAAGIKPHPQMQGRSLLPVLRGKRGGWRDSFFCEYFSEPNFPRIPTWQAVRTTRWKYIHYPELQGADELYDLDADKLELQNRIGDTAHSKALEQLRARCAADAQRLELKG